MDNDETKKGTADVDKSKSDGQVKNIQVTRPDGEPKIGYIHNESLSPALEYYLRFKKKPILPTDSANPKSDHLKKDGDRQVGG